MNISAFHLIELAPHCPPAMAIALSDCLPAILEQYAINTPLRMAHFLAQTCHESGGFERFEENLNYSAEGLARTFPRYFKTTSPKAFAHQPEMIANYVYALRNGNGKQSTGDGWKFRGRGMIQLTGKTNYTAFAQHIGHDVIARPDWLTTPAGAAASAAWYWQLRHINTAADADNVEKVTRLVNGGILGLAERRKLTAIAKKWLA
jgi:putative chitinase